MRLFTVDAFTNDAFKGNPAGVCILETSLKNEANYLKISQEINLSETAFVYPENDYFVLRWFTPTTEVELCGHATLAAAKILFEKYSYSQKSIKFKTLSGFLHVQKEDDLLVMNFPLKEVLPLDDIPTPLLSFLDQKPNASFINQSWRLFHLKNEKAITTFQPDYSFIDREAILVIITAPSNDSKYDFVSRVFAPYFGIPEDPVTGSAHCLLASYWSQLLNKNQVTGHQVSSRSGIVYCEVLPQKRVLLKGHSVIMSELLIEWNFQ